MSEEILEHLEKRKSNRRAFVQKLGMAGVAAGVVSAITPSKLQADPTSPTDADILNFALNLEFLEAEFYTVATTGLSVSDFGIIDYGTGTTGGTTTGGAQVTFTDNYTQQVALELAANEREHVALLQTALAGMGGSIAKPAINLNALSFGFGSQADFLTLARIFEDIGVSAYGGAAGLISDKGILGTAARILGIEAEHAGAIRLLIAQQGISTTATALDGADILPPPSGVQIFSSNANALTAVRTPGEVLFLAYGGANKTSGGFFPAGVNGNLVTSASAGANTDAATFTANPNPIAANGATYVATTLSWNAPNATAVEVHVGAPDGALFAQSGSTGSSATGTWVTDGMTFYLQDTSGGNLLIPQYTLATLTVHFQ